MQIHLLDVIRSLAAFVAGGVIGFVFGKIQEFALRRNEQRQKSGDLKSGWAVMPGSGRRVAYLLLTLVVVQMICPFLFLGGSQWWVSGGVVAGYGGSLFLQFRQRHAGR